MKTIKEKADEFIGHPQEIGEDLSCAMARKAYIQGARSQREIDLNKAKAAFESACGWLKVYPWYAGVLDEFIAKLKE